MEQSKPDAPKLIIPGDDLDEKTTGYKLPEPPSEEGAEPEGELWRTCFVVALDMNGVAHAHNDIEKFCEGKRFERGATQNDMWLGVAQVHRDLDAVSTAQRVLLNMQALGAAMQEQMATEQILQQVNQPNRAQRRHG